MPLNRTHWPQMTIIKSDYWSYQTRKRLHQQNLLFETEELSCASLFLTPIYTSKKSTKLVVSSKSTIFFKQPSVNELVRKEKLKKKRCSTSSHLLYLFCSMRQLPVRQLGVGRYITPVMKRTLYERNSC